MNVLTMLLVLCVIVALLFSIVKDMGKARRSRQVILQVDPDSIVNVEKDPEGITVRVRYATFEDRPDDAELFPDIVNVPVKSDYALDEIFWNRLAHIDEMDPQVRKDMLDKLCEHGFIRREDFSRMSFRDGIPEGGSVEESVEEPGGESVEESEEESGEADDISQSSPVMPDDFFKPFN